MTSTPSLDRWQAELVAGKRTRNTFDALWRAACWESAAVDARSTDREHHCQVQAIGTLLFGWSVGDSPAAKSRRERVSLTLEWQRRYLAALAPIQ